MENPLRRKINAAELRDTLNQLESSGIKLEDYEVLISISDFNSNRLEGYAATGLSTLNIKDENYFRIKAFVENKSVYK